MFAILCAINSLYNPERYHLARRESESDKCHRHIAVLASSQTGCVKCGCKVLDISPGVLPLPSLRQHWPIAPSVNPDTPVTWACLTNRDRPWCLLELGVSEITGLSVE
ncbi:hypothetical protein PoB_002715000 [Plakobranchus ocellatus]|uniref:Uncharacterized protein n=1 Tax=Plakobranchus ocellatus TaxID=259542 RepID=A0AAV4A156_9GAST|nr:hypothetical protein PoB_002715000 [Plakobranchus ocellatus]